MPFLNVKACVLDPASPVGMTSVTKSMNTCISSKNSVVAICPALQLPIVASGIVSARLMHAKTASSPTWIALLGIPTTTSLQRASTKIFLKKCFVASKALSGASSPAGVYLPKVIPLAISLRKLTIVPANPTFFPSLILPSLSTYLIVAPAPISLNIFLKFSPASLRSFPTRLVNLDWSTLLSLFMVKLSPPGFDNNWSSLYFLNWSFNDVDDASFFVSEYNACVSKLLRSSMDITPPSIRVVNVSQLDVFSEDCLFNSS